MDVSSEVPLGCSKLGGGRRGLTKKRENWEQYRNFLERKADYTK